MLVIYTHIGISRVQHDIASLVAPRDHTSTANILTQMKDSKVLLTDGVPDICVHRVWLLSVTESRIKKSGAKKADAVSATPEKPLEFLA